MEKITHQRENNYDLLRIISSIAVITIHVSVSYLNAITDDSILGNIYVDNIDISCLYNVLSRFAVPCFLMLSGAFILSDNRNGDYKFFYKKSLNNIGIHTIIFSILYFLYSQLLAIAFVILKEGSLNELFLPIKSFLAGEPYYHMWYLYMLIGVYLMVPVAIRLKQDIGEKFFCRFTVIFLILASLSVWTSTYKLKWNIGLSFCYLGYFFVGYIIRKWSYRHKNNLKGILLFVAGILIELLMAYLRYCQLIGKAIIKVNVIAPYCPLVVVASILIFMGFSMMNIKKDYSKISTLTIYIYLFHAGVWNLGIRVIKSMFGISMDSRIVIPVSILCVFIVSLILSDVYRKIWNKVDDKYSITGKLCKLVRLN